MPALCPDCGQTKYQRVRRTECSKCHGLYKGYVISPTAKDCNGSNCDKGVKKNNRGKDCDDCQGTGKKLTRCNGGCVNGYMEYSCLDEFHN